ncbi:MAG: transposase [Candidatus Magnetobacterium sp. LHC-1]
MKIETDNIEFQKEIYYSPSLNKTYRGEVPSGYEGAFGPSIKAMTIIMKYVCNTSEPKILEFFQNYGIYISGATISNMLVKNNEMLHKEKEDIYRSGLRSSIYQQIDDTGTKVNGENYYTHVVCNELYAAYFTTKHKDRLTIIDILRGSGSRSYCFNEETFKLLKDFSILFKFHGKQFFTLVTILLSYF